MIIKILGTGCSRCTKLENNTKEALKQLGLLAEIIKVTDVQEIISYGVISSPALIIDNKLVMYGKTPSVEEIIKLINANK
jgi:small redox-active disulfide protein 2